MDSIKDFEINSPRWLSLENFEGEVWKDIKEYEGLYQISNFGRIKRLPRTNRGLGNKFSFKIRKLDFDKDGYCIVWLYKNGIKKAQKVHRLVLQAFVPNLANLPIVNHKDENKRNNTVFVNSDGSVDFEKSNIEWCTAKYNCNYGTSLERISLKLTNRRDMSHPVVCYNTNGIFVKEYPSVSEARRDFGKHISHIYKVVSKGGGLANGYLWFNKGEEQNLKEVLKKKYRFPKPIIQMSLQHEYIAEFKNAQEAARVTGICANNILECCRHEQSYAKGYLWIYKSEYEQLLNTNNYE